MTTLSITSLNRWSSFSTKLSNLIGDSTVVKTEQLTGPLGGVGWNKITLSDGRAVFIGEKLSKHRMLPKWISSIYPDVKLIQAGSGSKWRAFITEIAVNTVSDGCTCQKCGKIYRVDVIVDDNLWEKISGKTDGSGMICGKCIIKSVEKIGFAAYRLIKI